MRDTDQNRSTIFLTRAKSGIQNIQDLKNKKVGFGAIDSPQARLIPLNHLAKNGLHGDYIGGEKEAFEALKKGEIDVSVCVDLNYEAWKKDGSIDETQIICFEKTPNFDHCIFTVREGFTQERLEEWERILFKMDYSNPKHKEMMNMEGLKKWAPGRTIGFTQLQEAVKCFNFFK